MLLLPLMSATWLLACDPQPASAPDPEKPRQRFTPTTTVNAEPGQRQAPPVAEGAMRHVVVVVVDTLRDDALTRAATPTIDGLVKKGAERSWAWAPSTWTAPSVISLFTGSSVRRHGWDFPFPSKMDRQSKSYPGLPEGPLLAEVMGEAGFRTTGLYGNRMLGQGLGYGRGFERWEWGDDETLTTRLAQETRTWDPQDRHFIYLHLMGPHHPLTPSKESRARYGLTNKDFGKGGGMGMPSTPEAGELEQTAYWRAYHASVEDTDSRLGIVLRAMRPWLKETMILVTSDHGELLGERGKLGHKAGVWEPLTRVPVVAWNAPPLPSPMSVSSVADLVTTAAGVTATWPVTATSTGPLVSQREGDLALSPDGVNKGIWTVEGAAMAYDLSTDPSETTPLASVPAPVSAAKATWQAATPAGVLQASDAAMDDELVQALEQLGYLE